MTYDLVLLDPPYSMLQLIDHLEADLPAMLAPAGRAVLDRAAGDAAPEPALEVLAERAYGGTRSPSWRHAESVAVCPGTYDPVTKGHLDVIRPRPRV